MTKYEMLSENDVLKLSRLGDRSAEDFLLEQYRPMVLHLTRELHLWSQNSIDIEDFVQEGMIGLFNAIRDFDLESDANFSTFAYICIKNKLKNTLTYINRKKHLPLKNYEHLEFYNADNERLENENVISDLGANNPESIVLIDEDIRELYRDIDEKLSELEKKVIYLYLEGYSRKEIASTLGKGDKSVDNALTRIKTKLKK